jgi:outer membrane protein assembly factor BamB
MRVSLIVFLFIFFSNCSKINKIETSVQDLKKEGTIILEKKEITIAQNNIKLISKIFPDNLNKKNKKKNNLNFFTERKVRLFKGKKKNPYKKNILVTKNNIFFIDDKSNFFILTHELEVIKKIPIYKKKDFKNYFLKFSLFEHNDIIYFLDNLGGIFSFDLKQGVFIWKNNFQIPFFSNILFYKNYLYAVNANGKVFSFDSKTGGINWTLETGSQMIKSPSGFKIAVYANKLFFTNDVGSISCIDLVEKKFLWSTSVNNFLNAKSFEVSNIKVENNELYLSSNYGSLVKINFSNGRKLWSQISDSSLDPIINNKTVAIISSNGLLTVYSKKNGNILYKKNIFDILKDSKIKKMNIKINNSFSSYDKFFFTTENGYFLTMSFNDLDTIVFKKISKQIMSNIGTSEKNFFFIGDNKYIYKIK